LWFVLLLSLCVAIPLTADAAFFLRRERGTYSRSYVVQTPGIAEEAASSQTVRLRRFDEFDATSVVRPPSICASNAWLDSNIAKRGARASGRTMSFIYAFGDDRRVETPADSVFDLHFLVAEGEPFRLRGQVDAEATLAESHAYVEIVGDDGVVVFESEAAPGETHVFDTEGTLSAGRYRLTGVAQSFGEVADVLDPPTMPIRRAIAGASFEAVLFVPEPSVALAARCTLLVMALIVAKRPRAGARK
jgi:hypothetical protein